MQTPHPSPAEIATTITKLFESLPDRLGDKNTDGERTTQIKEDIGSLGDKHGWGVCTSGFPRRFDPEWLYDLIWYRNEPDIHLAEVYLVMESEWSVAPSDIKFDFEKILLAKAALKIMVFQAREYKLAEIFNLLDSGIRAFQKKCSGEIYILAGYDNINEAFDVRQIPVP
jgi:hypothetical protein